MHSIKSRCDIEPGNRLFAGMSVHFQPGHFTGWGSEGVKNDSPNYLAQPFISHQSHYANSRNNFYVPRPRFDLFETSISFAGASLWNSLLQNIKSCISLPCFKRIRHKYMSEITFRQIWTDLFESHVCLNI